jgi:endonuclease G
MAKNTTRYLLLTIIIVAVFILVLLLIKDRQDRQQVPSDAPTTQNETTDQASPNRVPLSDYLPTSSNRQFIRRTHYAFSYLEEHEQAEWVAYELTAEEVAGSAERTDDFREDPEVATGSATLKDYYRSGYDRGHLAPAGDMKFSEEAMSESFYMSNMSPQKPAFNRGIWRELEEEVRELAVENGSLFVITGPVFGEQVKKIGESGVSIPKAYYKVLLDYTEPEVKAIAFLLANEGSKKDVYEFAVTVDSVEAVTNIDFFPALPDLEENMLESQFNASLWIGDD